MKVQVILKNNNNILSYIITLLCYVNRVVRLFSTFSPCAFVSNPMEKRVERFGYEVTFNPRGDGDFFYASAAKALGIETQGLKNVIFDFLKSHQFDASILLIANSPTTKISLLSKLAVIFTGIFGQNSQQSQIAKRQSSDPRCVLI